MDSMNFKRHLNFDFNLTILTGKNCVLTLQH